MTFLSGIGSRRARLLIAHFNDLEQFFTEQKLDLSRIPGIPASFVSYKQRLAALEAADSVLEHLDKLEAHSVFFTDTDYPKRLKQCEDAPLLLYGKGNINWNPERVVSIVGTRRASDYGKTLTTTLVEGLQASGSTIVSGMAYGIDICAHTAALQAGLPTIGVLGHGLHVLYPHAHRKTAKQMLDTGGLATEFAPGLKPEPAYFPMRNRIVAGMADVTVVVESGEKGGSLITANLANDYNRDVCAYPGDVTRPASAGCLKLIKEDKAHLITGPEDLLTLLDWKTEKAQSIVQRNLFTELTAIEERIVAVLKTQKDLAIDAICFLASLPLSEASVHLLGLEFKGLVRPMPGNRYSLI